MPVFKLLDLTNLCYKRLRQHGRFNSTRLKGRLLVAVPDLTAHVHTNEEDFPLLYDSTVINLACESSFDSDAVLFAKAAKICSS